MASERDAKQPDKSGGRNTKNEKELQGKSSQQYQITG